MADGDEGWQLVDYSAEGHDRRQIREWGQTAGHWSGYGRHVTSKDIRWKLREGEMLGYGGTGLVEQVTYRSVMMARKKIRAARNVSVEKIKEEANIMEKLVHRHIVELVGTYVRGQSELNILIYPAAVTDLDQFLSDIQNLRLGTSSVFGDVSRRFDQLGFKGISLNTNREEIDEFLEGPLRFLASILGCITEAVLYMHTQQVRHRDITPKNILLSPQQVYLADFGSSKLLENDSDLLTDEFGLGTPIFLAPEVVERKGHRMAPADIYSLGCVFLFVATALYGATQVQLEKATSHRQNPKERTLEVGKYVDKLRSLAAAKGKAHENELTCMPKHILATTQVMLADDPSARPTIEQVHKTMYEIGGIDQIYHGKCCKKDSIYISKIIDGQISDAHFENVQSLQKLELLETEQQLLKQKLSTQVFFESSLEKERGHVKAQYEKLLQHRDKELEAANKARRELEAELAQLKQRKSGHKGRSRFFSQTQSYAAESGNSPREFDSPPRRPSTPLARENSDLSTMGSSIDSTFSRTTGRTSNASLDSLRSVTPDSPSIAKPSRAPSLASCQPQVHQAAERTVRSWVDVARKPKIVQNKQQQQPGMAVARGVMAGMSLKS